MLTAVINAWFDRKKQEHIGYDFELTVPNNWMYVKTNLNDRHICAVHGFKG